MNEISLKDVSSLFKYLFVKKREKKTKICDYFSNFTKTIKIVRKKRTFTILLEYSLRRRK